MGCLSVLRTFLQGGELRGNDENGNEKKGSLENEGKCERVSEVKLREKD